MIPGIKLEDAKILEITLKDSQKEMEKEVKMIL